MDAERCLEAAPGGSPATGWIPVWWLPWQSKHVVKIKIRSNVATPIIAMPNPIDDIPNPKVFFTAAINGCSVFAVGDVKNPSLYHGGVDGDFDGRQSTESTEAAWRRLIGRADSQKTIHSVGKTDYITELDPAGDGPDARLRINGAKTTQLAADFENQLKSRGNLTNVTASPWGMVFGVRDAVDNWEMTLVKNSFLVFHRLTTKTTKRFIIKDKVETTRRGEVRGQRVYDADGGFTETFPVTNEQAIQNCVTLGYKNFFPGPGHVQLYDQTHIQVF